MFNPVWSERLFLALFEEVDNVHCSALFEEADNVWQTATLSTCQPPPFLQQQEDGSFEADKLDWSLQMKLRILIILLKFIGKPSNVIPSDFLHFELILGLRVAIFKNLFN